MAETTTSGTTQFNPLDRTALAAAAATGTGLLASCNYNNNTKSFVPGATTAGPATGAGSNASKSKWPKRPTAVTSATCRPSRITKMMNRLRPRSRSRPGRKEGRGKVIELTADSGSFLDEEEDTTTGGGAGGNEFVSTATVTFALSTVYCVDCDEREPTGEP